MLHRRQLLAGLTTSFAFGFALPAQAEQSWFFIRNGDVINGYDPVSYFVDGKPVRGRPELKLKWKRGMWSFASASNRAAFEANPKAYAPQYGGYCAYAVSRGYTAKTEPDAWRIVDGKLYLNFNTRVRALWERDVPGNIAKANAHWPSVLYG
ncbi:YHS domain-containing (seleno)protein [Thalassococcus sp. S3]|uniref:YHS domain-containing (seleno)protein n=1 Tax=Thalassococcus sp. S3 TaxID=2017482 RepID=UPI0010241A89|nr:YHS domain-containing (seleno)protein [Thalassococcus sp. S3]QBF32499.1 YHS domain protein [Thalassococcus sp. S3]